MANAYACGYVNGIQSNSITCSTGYCGFNSLYSAAGCCYSTVPGPSNSYSLTGCDFTTACYDSTDVDGSNYNTMDLLCTDSASPYCARYTFTDIGYAASFCADTGTILEAALTAYDVGDGAAASATGGTAAAIASFTDKFPAATTAAATRAAATSKAGAGAAASETGGPAAGNPFPNAQGTAGAVGSPTMVRGNGCAGGGPGKVGVVAVVAAVAGMFVGC